jgi:hypothetical protein
MTDTNDKLVKTGKLGLLKVGMAARVQQAQLQGGMASDLLDFSKYPNRIILCIDDSGSMSSSMNPSNPEEYGVFERGDEKSSSEKKSRMYVCRQACEEFINVCNSRDTALGMYTISTQKEYPLSNNFTHLLLQVKELRDSGGTPTIKTLEKIQEKENVTRVVVISDGESGALDYNNQFTSTARQVLDVYKNKKIIIDTVFIGETGSNGEREMQFIAEHTGGLFLAFKSGESFRTKFKYLAPAFRGMLTSGQVKI